MRLAGKKTMSTLLGCSLLVILLTGGTALAQGHGGGGGGHSGGGGQGGSGGGQRGADDRMQGGFGGGDGMGGRGGVPGGLRGEARGGMHGRGVSVQTGPVGRWWDDKGYASALGLRPEQRKRMDAIFNESRGELAERYQALRTEESKLESATRESKTNQGNVFGQIDRVAQARDALEKTNTKLMGAIRKELDADQAARMQTLK